MTSKADVGGMDSVRNRWHTHLFKAHFHSIGIYVADVICDGIKGSIDEMQALDQNVVDLVEKMSDAPANNGASSPGAVHFP